MRGKGPVYDNVDKKKAEPRREKRRLGAKKGKLQVRRREVIRVIREASVTVQADWKVLDQWDLTQFVKLQTAIPKVEDL